MTRARPAAPRACVASPTAVRGPILTKYKYFAFTLIRSIYIDETAIFLAIESMNEVILVMMGATQTCFAVYVD